MTGFTEQLLWDQIFAYRHDGEYSIDNMAVERALRPLTVQRKNGLFFCSHKGARNSGIYNTFISTCQQKCRNFRDFFVDYVREWNRGRRDFGNLVKLAFNPTTNQNKLNFIEILKRWACQNACPKRNLRSFGRLPKELWR